VTFFDRLVKQGSGFSDEQALKYFSQIVQTVHELHEQNVCHLDLSLENMLISEERDCIVLCDFGMSQKCVDENATIEIVTESPYLPGKLSYIAPELYARKQGTLDAKLVDSYALGIILFILILGVPPYKAPTTKDPAFRLLYTGNMKKLCRSYRLAPPSDEIVNIIQSLVCPASQRMTLDELQSALEGM